MLLKRQAVIAALFSSAVTGHSSTGHHNHRAVRRRIGSIIDSDERNLEHRTMDMEVALAARSPALDPTDGTILELSDVAFYDGTEDGDCSW